MKSLQEAIRPTTFIESSKLRNCLGGLDITVAAETFQHTGSFKFRAGYNLALNVPNDEILTASSGNFGQALAYACQLLGKKCTVVMPATSARVKIDSVRDYGATVDLVDTTQITRSARVAELAAEMPRAYVASAYDDQLVIDGNATLGAELATHNFDMVVSPIGGDPIDCIAASERLRCPSIAWSRRLRAPTGRPAAIRSASVSWGRMSSSMS